MVYLFQEVSTIPSIRNEIKSYITSSGKTVYEVAEGMLMSASNLSNKLTRETLRYTEALMIAEILNKQIMWIDKPESKTPENQLQLQDVFNILNETNNEYTTNNSSSESTSSIQLPEGIERLSEMLKEFDGVITEFEQFKKEFKTLEERAKEMNDKNK